MYLYQCKRNLIYRAINIYIYWRFKAQTHRTRITPWTLIYTSSSFPFFFVFFFFCVFNLLLSTLPRVSVDIYNNSCERRFSFCFVPFKGVNRRGAEEDIPGLLFFRMGFEEKEKKNFRLLLYETSLSTRSELLPQCDASIAAATSSTVGIQL